MSNNGFYACVVEDKRINNSVHFLPLKESLLTKEEIGFIEQNNHVFKEDVRAGYPLYLKIQELINDPEIIPWDKLLEFEIQNELDEIPLTRKITENG